MYVTDSPFLSAALIVLALALTSAFNTSSGGVLLFSATKKALDHPLFDNGLKKQLQFLKPQSSRSLRL